MCVNLLIRFPKSDNSGFVEEVTVANLAQHLVCKKKITQIQTNIERPEQIMILNYEVDIGLVFTSLSGADPGIYHGGGGGGGGAGWVRGDHQSHGRIQDFRLGGGGVQFRWMKCVSSTSWG